MKSLKKCFGLGVGRKSGLSFAKLLCGLVMLAVPLCTVFSQEKFDVHKVLGKENYKASELMIAVPGQNFSILATEVTQELYESVMGENPSSFKGEKNLPVEQVSWYDAVVFCNKLSVMDGLVPVYSVSNKTDVSEWDYTPSIYSEIKCNENASGYRLPTWAEWQYAARGGENYKYSGSDNLDEVGWYKGISEKKTHPVAQKKPNGYGLYDMSGNVAEWCWDFGSSDSRRYRCGGWYSNAKGCEVGCSGWSSADNTDSDHGFRVVRSTGK